MTFSKSHDIKVMALVFRPIKQISWHWGVGILLKLEFWWRLKKNDHNTCVGYFLNGIHRQIYLIEMFLASLKINMKHPKTSVWIRVDSDLWRHNAQNRCFPITTMCVKSVSCNETFGYIGCRGKCQHNVTGVSGTQFQQCWHFVDIHVVPM